jgi:hypothetical protein
MSSTRHRKTIVQLYTTLCSLLDIPTPSVFVFYDGGRYDYSYDGGYSINNDGRAHIRFIEAPDPTIVVHEITHHIQISICGYEEDRHLLVGRGPVFYFDIENAEIEKDCEAFVASINISKLLWVLKLMESSKKKFSGTSWEKLCKLFALVRKEDIDIPLKPPAQERQR